MNPNISLAHIMSRQPFTIALDATIKTIRDLMERENIHHLIVVKKDQEVIGIISTEDLRKVANWIEEETTGKVLSQKLNTSWTAERIMTPNPLVLDEEDTIGLAADIILQNQFHAIPIVDNGILVGLVTSHDLLRYAYSGVVEQEES